MPKAPLEERHREAMRLLDLIVAEWKIEALHRHWVAVPFSDLCSASIFGSLKMPRNS